MDRNEIWNYVMAIRDNVIVTLDPPKEGKKEALMEQRKTVVSFEKKMLMDIESDADFQYFIKCSIDCALGEYPFEDLVALYDTLSSKS